MGIQNAEELALMARQATKKGLSVKDIASTMDMSDGSLRDMIKRHFGQDEYRESLADIRLMKEKAKQAQLEKIVLKGRAKVAELLDKGLITDPKELCTIEKTYGDRLALSRGEATASPIQIVLFNNDSTTNIQAGIINDTE